MAARFINFCIGLWLIISPLFLTLGEGLADNNYILGPIVASMALIAVSESTRNVRFGNTLAGVWLLIVPWLFGQPSELAIVSEVGAGVALVGLSLVKGKVKNSFGGGWRSLLTKYPKHVNDAEQVGKVRGAADG